MKKVVIGIDIGTSAVKVIAVDQAGHVLETISEEYPIYMEANGHSEQDPADWWDKTAQALKSLATAYEVAALGFSGQMHGLVALDENDNVLHRAILWNDSRTTAECDALNSHKDVLLQNTANVALTGFTAPKILWLKNNKPEIFAKIKKIMLPKDYIAYKLTGVFATDYSDASGMLLMDVKNKCWSVTMLDMIGITEAQLPKLYNAYDVIGNVSAQAAAETGLSTTTQVIIGGGDQAVGAVGAGVVADGMSSISLGTSGVIFVASDNFAVDTNPSAVHSFCHASGKYHFMGVTLSAAGSNKWWMEDILNTTDYTQEQAGYTGPGSIYFLPYLTGERTPINDPAAQGAFVGMAATTTRRQMTQAVLEGVGYSLKDVLESIKAMGASVKNARIIGGGANSPLWCQIIADMLGITIHKIQASEGPAFGAAILAMVGAGLYPSVEDACSKLIATTEAYEPNMTNHEKYSQGYQTYKKIYLALKEV